MGFIKPLQGNTYGIWLYLFYTFFTYFYLYYIYFPQEENHITKSKEDFYRVYAKCIGSDILYTHIKIESPGIFLQCYSFKIIYYIFFVSGGVQTETFRNRRVFFSLNVQAICNTKLQFIDIVARWPRSAYDSRIFANSRIKEKFENGDLGNSILVGPITRSHYTKRSFIQWSPNSNKKCYWKGIWCFKKEISCAFLSSL